LLLVRVKALAVIAAHTLGDEDLRPLDRAPLARLLTDLARVALRPALDAEDRQVRDHAERGAKRAEEPAIEVPHEHARDQQDAARDPHRPRPQPAENPE